MVVADWEVRLESTFEAETVMNVQPAKELCLSTSIRTLVSCSPLGHLIAKETQFVRSL